MEDRRLKPEEIRIGNIVKYKDGTVMPVEYFDLGIAVLTTPSGGNWDFNFAYLYPLRISKEVLESFGFTKIETSVDSSLDVYSISGEYFGYIEYHKIKQQYRFFLCDKEKWVMIRYAHKLQNLFYELSGKELLWKKNNQ